MFTLNIILTKLVRMTKIERIKVRDLVVSILIDTMNELPTGFAKYFWECLPCPLPLIVPVQRSRATNFFPPQSPHPHPEGRYTYIYISSRPISVSPAGNVLCPIRTLLLELLNFQIEYDNFLISKSDVMPNMLTWDSARYSVCRFVPSLDCSSYFMPLKFRVNSAGDSNYHAPCQQCQDNNPGSSYPMANYLSY